MKFHFKASIICSLLLAALTITGCGTCGFDCSSDDDEADAPTLLTLGFSDALPEDLTQVVLEVDSIILERTGQADVRFDTFIVQDQKDPNEPQESFQLDLLAYRGAAQFLVIQDQEMEPGKYSGIVINLTDQDLGNSYVIESDNSRHTLVTSNSGLQVAGISLSEGRDTTYTIEFELPRSLRYEDSDDSYLLGNEGVRVVDNAASGLLAGAVDEQLFDSESPCSEKADPLKGNRVYLYEGVDLDVESLGDVFTQSTAEGVISPFAVSTLVESTSTTVWEHVFGYLPTGDYTIAFTCAAEEDDPDAYDELLIPFPKDQLYEVNVTTSGTRNCNFELDNTDAC